MTRPLLYIVSVLTQLFSSVSVLSWAGDRDRTYDLLILTGPGIVIAIALLGRNILTISLAGGYIVVFLAHLAVVLVRS